MEDRDDLIEYSLYNHHDEAHGKKLRKKIMMVTLILTVITGFEIFMGIKFSKGVMEHSNPGAWLGIKILYIVLTLTKAGYIILSFMHLGDEKKALKYMILIPYVAFIIYLFFICRNEGLAVFVWN
jgi:cytochrome c oxidase subunit 4